MLDPAAHEVAEPEHIRIGDTVEYRRAVPTPVDESLRVQELEVLGDVGLSGVDLVHQVPDGQLTVPQDVEEPQAHGLAQRAEPVRDGFEHRWGETIQRAPPVPHILLSGYAVVKARPGPERRLSPGYLLALLIGLALGLLGGGGSILTVPVLHYVLRFDVREAVPMSLVVVGLTSAFGALQHRRHGTVDLRSAVAFGPPAVVGALLGAELGLRSSAALQLLIFAVVMIAAAVSMWAGQGLLARRSGPDRPAGRGPLVLILLLGGLVGVLTGFVGVGGGFLYVPALVLLGGLRMKDAVGTSLVLILLSCIAGFLRYEGSLTLDWRAIGLFTAIAFVGVAIGSRLARNVSPELLRRGFAAFLLVMGAIVLLVGR